jgi:lipopolysaccharide transport system ATP-binding protein
MAEDVIIRAECLGKKYIIGHEMERERYVALRDVIARGGKNAWRRTVDIARGRALVVGDKTEEFWALKDVSFEVKRGEVLGIIGRNGAGKSTLLKILSRITEPSEGRATIRGRVASLLEVGTGFHPELTGRENIYLNGAILGMTHAEIKRKFDEIVAFAEVETFLDTPVKRYSSGMHVRLAFAVAAHLEPEILIVDEVLAVGDAEFQRKSLGKMHDASRGGRTVLFVSHNMAAVKSLTDRALVINAGQLVFRGQTGQAIEKYGALTALAIGSSPLKFSGRGKHTLIRAVRLLDERGAPTRHYVSGSPIRLEIEIETDGTRGLSCDVMVLDQAKAKTALASLSHFQGKMLPTEEGVYRLLMPLGPLHLAAGHYSLDVTTAIVNQNWDHYVHDALSFDVQFSNPGGLSWNFSQSFGHGVVALPFESEVSFERVDALEAAS